MTANGVDAGGPDRMYPVLVTFTRTHVIWAAASSLKAAALAIATGDDPTTPDTLADQFVHVRAPRTRTEWNLVDQPGEPGDGYPGMVCDAHVRARPPQISAAARAECAAAGHPGSVPDPLDLDARYCPTCAALIPIVAADPVLETNE